MKKWLFLLLALCLPTAALADHVATEWFSPTGKTVIHLDAEVRVPEDAAMDLIPVEGAAFDTDTVSALAELLWPGLNATIHETSFQGQGYRGHTAGVVVRGIGGEDVQVDVGASYRDQLLGMEGICGSRLSGMVARGLSAYDGQTVNYVQTPLDEEVTGEGIEGHALTRAQAAQAAEDFMRQLTGEDFRCFLVGQGQGLVFSDEPVPGPAPESSYVVVLTRVVDGVPLLPGLFQDMSQISRTDLFAPPVGYEKAEVKFDREGHVVCFYWWNLWQRAGEAVPQTLLPFEDILAVAERMLPLKYLWLEPHTEQLLIDVNRVELGYMALMQRDTQTFALTPVWVFYAGGEMLPNYMDVLTVNAVDGTVIDMELGY